MQVVWHHCTFPGRSSGRRANVLGVNYGRHCHLTPRGGGEPGARQGWGGTWEFLWSSCQGVSGIILSIICMASSTRGPLRDRTVSRSAIACSGSVQHEISLRRRSLDLQKTAIRLCQLQVRDAGSSESSGPLCVRKQAEVVCFDADQALGTRQYNERRAPRSPCGSNGGIGSRRGATCIIAVRKQRYAPADSNCPYRVHST